jgi:hypothetical protein
MFPMFLACLFGDIGFCLHDLQFGTQLLMGAMCSVNGRFLDRFRLPRLNASEGRSVVNIAVNISKSHKRQ